MKNYFLELAKELKDKSVEEIALQLEKIDSTDIGDTEYTEYQKFIKGIKRLKEKSLFPNRKQFGFLVEMEEDGKIEQKLIIAPDFHRAANIARRSGQRFIKIEELYNDIILLPEFSFYFDDVKLIVV